MENDPVAVGGENGLMSSIIVPIGPFRYRRSVRYVAVIDACIAFFMLTFLGLRFLEGAAKWNESLETTSRTSNGDPYTPPLVNGDRVVAPNIFLIITITILGIYALQLIMAQVLMTATYKQVDTEIILARCQKWFWTSQFLHVILGIELFIIVFSIRGGTPFAFAICLIKIVFRAVANHLVKMYMWDLRTRPPAFPFIATISNPFPPLGSHHSGGGIGGVSIPTYEAPPSYEEAVRDKDRFQNFVVDVDTLSPTQISLTEEPDTILESDMPNVDPDTAAQTPKTKQPEPGITSTLEEGMTSTPVLEITLTTEPEVRTIPEPEGIATPELQAVTTPEPEIMTTPEPAIETPAADTPTSENELP